MRVALRSALVRMPRDRFETLGNVRYCRISSRAVQVVIVRSKPAPRRGNFPFLQAARPGSSGKASPPRYHRAKMCSPFMVYPQLGR